MTKIGYTVFIISGFPSYPSGRVSDPKYKRKIFYIETIETLTVIRLRLPILAYTGYLRRLLIFSSFVFGTIIFLPKISRITGRIDIVYSIAPTVFSSFSGFVYSKLFNCFMVYEVSDLWPEEFVVFPSRFLPIIMMLGKAIAKLSYMLPDLILAISDLAAEHITKVYRPKARISVFPIGVDPNSFTAVPKDLARREILKLGIVAKDLDHKFVILYSGLISRGTAVDNIAHAAKKLKEEGGGEKQEQIAFLIVGDGEGKHQLEELKLKYKLTNLYLAPFQPRNIMPMIISASDICVVSLPSEQIYNVDVPTKFYEYLACSKPIIGICNGDLAEIINRNKIGGTVKVGETDKLVLTIRKFKNCPDLVHTMEESSKKLLQNFTLDSLAVKLVDLLEKKD